ncbi:hypothetical protein D9611_005305 [Ephemerocybe angulata]|uniref:Uncharacterized protein n=1 Tax=Ephemerocybe angulata TaxID=980116 RepID=A0A8H5C100_9AGAR|nr:hypothetical protein D9611_005305 [Tulosesus angulatus]
MTTEYKTGTRVCFVRPFKDLKGTSVVEGEYGEVAGSMKSLAHGTYTYTIKLEKNGVRVFPVEEDDILDVPAGHTAGMT